MDNENDFEKLKNNLAETSSLVENLAFNLKNTFEALDEHLGKIILLAGRSYNQDKDHDNKFKEIEKKLNNAVVKVPFGPKVKVSYENDDSSNNIDSGSK